MAGLSKVIALAGSILWGPLSPATATNDAQPAPWRERTDFIELATDHLRKAGRYREADELAREILKQVRDDPAAPPHAKDIALCAEQTLDRLASLPESTQVAFCRLENEYWQRADCWRAEDFSPFSRVQTNYQQAIERIFGHNHYETARALLCAEQNYRNWGHFVQAERCAREALAIDLNLFPKDHPVVAGAVGALGCALMSQGRLDEAEPLMRAVLANVIANEGDGTNDAAGCYNSLGVALSAQGDYEGAEAMLRRAEEIQRSNCGFDHEIFLSSFAKVFLELGRLDEAETRVRKALDIYRDVHGEGCSEVALQLTTLADIKRRGGDLKAADSLYARAAAIDLKVLGTTHPQFLRPQISRAEIALELGNPASARDLLEPLLPVLDASVRVNERSWCLHTLGRALREQGKNADAEPLLAEAAGLYERARLRAGGEFKRATMRLKSPYTELALCRLDIGRPEQAWIAVESGLGRCLADLLLAGRARSADESARGDSLRQILNEREVELSALADQLRTDPSVQPARDKALAGLLEVEAAWSRFQSHILAGRGLPLSGGVSLVQVQAALDRNTAIIGWLDDDGGSAEAGRSWGYVLRRDPPVHWVRLPCLGRSPNSPGPEAAATYRAELVEAGTHQIRLSLDDQVEARARNVAAERIVPLLPQLAGVRRLVVIPSGPMLGVPLEALQLDGDGWLSDRFEVVYSPSATVFAALSDAHRTPPVQGNRILLVGDPAYQRPPEIAARISPDGGEFVATAAPADFSLTALNRDLPSTTEQALHGLAPLPHSRAEIQAIASMFHDATTLVGMRASEGNLAGLVTSGEIAQYRYLHFATHALVDDRTPERSGLVLSQVDLPEPAAAVGDQKPVLDGILSVKQIMRDWRLNAELVTLSGCGTALGRPARGEGYLGLAQTFLLAGAGSVLVSLWNVDDEATSLFMQRFYADLTGAETSPSKGVPMSKTAALGEARRFLREYRDAGGTRRFTHPCYWSAFVLVGDAD